MHVIQLNGNNYEVRVKGNRRQVKVEGKWIDAYDFVDLLADNRRWSELGGLALMMAKLLEKGQ